MRRRTFLMAAAARSFSQGQVKALTFDVFGTVVDWRSSITREGQALGKAKGLTADWAKFADAWRAGYGPSMARVRKGELPWTNIDVLHRMILDQLLKDFRIEGLTEQEQDYLNRAWHRLDAWPDAAEGLERLRQRYVCATLSNGNVSLLVNMAELLGCRPAEVMMVAAHKGDLQAARKVGLRTAFVTRPLEQGPGRSPEGPERRSSRLHEDKNAGTGNSAASKNRA